MKLKDIAEELNVGETLIRKWKNLDKWDEQFKGNVTDSISNVTKRKGAPKGNKFAAGHGPPKGSKNAAGNKGGNGGPSRNTKAIKTGEHQSLWMDALTNEEQEQLQRV